jgi:hypothetical protein
MRLTRVTLAGSGKVHSLSVHLDGNGGVQAGSQDVRLALYSDVGGKPRRLISATRPFTVSAQSAAAWYTSDLPTPVYLAAGSYWIAEWTGGTAKVSRHNGSWGPSGSRTYYATSAPYTSTSSPPSLYLTGGGSSFMLTAFMSVQR